MNDSIKKSVEPILADLVQNDGSSLIKAAAIQALGKYNKKEYKDLFIKSTNDSSYSVAGNSLLALGSIDSAAAFDRAKSLSKGHVKGALSRAITSTIYMYASENDFDSLSAEFDKEPFGNGKFNLLQYFSNYLKRINNPENFRKGIDMIVDFRDAIPEQFSGQILPYLNGMILNGIASAKEKMGMTELADYVRSKITGKKEVKEVSDIPAEILQKYTGEYDLDGDIIKVKMNDEKALILIFPDQPDMELSPISATKFNLKFMEGYTVEFMINDKKEVTSLQLTSSDEEITATRIK